MGQAGVFFALFCTVFDFPRNFCYFNGKMFKLARLSALLLTAGLGCASAQHVCPHFLLDSAMVVNVEGRFINAQNSRTSIDVEWRHHPEALDSFFVNLPTKSFVYVTAGEFRYMRYNNPKVNRQLGMHHLRETIGNTPLKLDDLELLANGSFLCKDSTDKRPNILSTAFSNMWWSLVADTLPQPARITMRGARKEARTFYVGAWKDFSGIQLPTLVTLNSENYSGNLWVRSAYPIEQIKKDPVAEKAKSFNLRTPTLFRKIPVEGKREIPLILKLNQEFLRD